MEEFWLISAPPMPTREKAYENVNEKTSNLAPLAQNVRIDLPQLKVGTLDSLMSLSDDLTKIDQFVESTTKRIGSQLLGLTAEENGDIPAYEALQIGDASIEHWLTHFNWAASKYPINSSCRNLTEIIQTQVGRIEEELRVKLADYTTIVHSISAAERKRTGNLMQRDLGDILKPSDFVNTESLTTVFVIISKFSYKAWEESYERMSEWVVPRSSKKITEDGDSGLFSVVVFKKYQDEFKEKVRMNRYQIREINPDETGGGDSEYHQLVQEMDSSKNTLTIWCKANFAEAFLAWIHLKIIRIHVESILRYGLPANYQAILMRPLPKQQKKLRKALEELFSHLSSGMSDGKLDDDVVVPGTMMMEEFYPYVYTPIVLNYPVLR